MNIFKNISQVSKRLILAGTAVVLSFAAVATPITNAVAANNQVELEGKVQVANVTAGDTDYKDEVNAKVDQVVKVQVWYHNRENPGSGKTANNLRVALGLGAVLGSKTQTISGTVQGDNTNKVEDDAKVNLSIDNAYLEYVPGSTKWRYNQGAYNGDTDCQTGKNPVPTNDPNDCYTTENLGPKGDKIMNGGVVVNDKMRPCFAYEATVTALFRVKASEVKVNKYVSAHDADHNPSNNDWKVKNSANPGDKLDYMIRFENKGNTQLEDIVVGDNLPDYMSYVPGSTYIINGNNPSGVAAGSDMVYQGGIKVGDYKPGAIGYVVFTVKIDDKSAFEYCGTYTLKNVGVVRPHGMNEFYNTAWTDVNIVCQPGEQPKPEKVCNPETGEIIEVPANEADQYEDVSSPACGGPTPEKPEVPQQPETPGTLPATGPASAIAGLLGTSGLAYGLTTFVNSRRRLSKALNQ